MSQVPVWTLWLIPSGTLLAGLLTAGGAVLGIKLTANATDRREEAQWRREVAARRAFDLIKATEALDARYRQALDYLWDGLSERRALDREFPTDPARSERIRVQLLSRNVDTLTAVDKVEEEFRAVISRTVDMFGERAGVPAIKAWFGENRGRVEMALGGVVSMVAMEVIALDTDLPADDDKDETG